MAPLRTIYDFWGKANNQKKHVTSQIDRPHHGISPEFICDQCNTTFKKKLFLPDHIRIVHNTSVNCWICDLCEKSFRTKLPLNTHIKRIHETDTAHFACKQCNKTFIKLHLLDNHIRGVHSTRLIVCDCCGKVFNDRKVFSVHFQSQHQRKLELGCPKCDQKFFNREAHQQHKFKAHRDKKYVCDQCGHVCKMKSTLATHSLVHQHCGRQNYQCSQCSVKFRTISNLQKHLSGVHKDKKFQCDACELMFGRKTYIINHIIAIHLKLRPFKCPECDDSFTQLGSVNLHVARMHRKKLMQCDECEAAARFSNRDHLATHIFAHVNMRRFKCEQCTAAYSSVKSLKLHKLSIHCAQL